MPLPVHAEASLHLRDQPHGKWYSVEWSLFGAWGGSEEGSRGGERQREGESREVEARHEHMEREGEREWGESWSRKGRTRKQERLEGASSPFSSVRHTWLLPGNLGGAQTE